MDKSAPVSAHWSAGTGQRFQAIISAWSKANLHTAGFKHTLASIKPLAGLKPARQPLKRCTVQTRSCHTAADRATNHSPIKAANALPDPRSAAEGAKAKTRLISCRLLHAASLDAAQSAWSPLKVCLCGAGFEKERQILVSSGAAWAELQQRTHRLVIRRSRTHAVSTTRHSCCVCCTRSDLLTLHLRLHLPQAKNPLLGML